MKVTRLLLPVFFLLLLIPSLLAATPEEQLRSLGYLTLIPIAFMVVLTIIGIAYMLSKLFSLPQLDAWCRMELGELGISIVIVFIILAIVGGSNSIVSTLTGETDYMSAANNALTSQIDNMNTLFEKLVAVNYAVSKVMGFSYTATLLVPIVVPYWSRAPMYGLMPLGMAIMKGLDAVSLAILITASEKLFLNFFSKVVLVYLLPIALVLRTFPFTKRIGAALIALSLGAYILFPFAIIITGGIFESIRDATGSPISQSNLDKIVTPDIEEQIKKEPSMSGIICNRFNPVFTLINEQGWSHIICDWLLTTIIGAPAWPACATIVHWVYWLTTMFFGVVAWPFLNNYVRVDYTIFYEPLYNVALPAVTMSVMLSIVLYLIVIIFTIVGTRSIAVALGGEAQLYGLGKLI